MERERAIMLGEPPSPPDAQYDWYKFKELPNGGYEKCWRIGEMRFEETFAVRLKDDDPSYRSERRQTIRRSAVVRYADILAHTQVVPDDDNTETPWSHCDGWEHDFDTSGHHDGNIEEMRGFVRHNHHTGEGLITIDPKKMGLSDWQYYHHQGASKQVARELAAQQVRNALGQLVEWYEHGWSWWGVKCEYKGYEDSVWGVDDEDYAEREVVHEIAGDVVYQMEKDGWLVVGKPQKSGLKYGWDRAAWHREFQRRLNSFNVEKR